MEYIYLIQEREYIRLGENTYKIGKTKQEPGKRMGQYPKDSQMQTITRVDNCDIAEKELIKTFTEKFKRRKDYGNEYFQGDYVEMIDIISKYACNKLQPKQPEVSIVHHFPNYIEDIAYGGTKKLVKLSVRDNNFIVIFINSKNVVTTHELFSTYKIDIAIKKQWINIIRNIFLVDRVLNLYDYIHNLDRYRQKVEIFGKLCERNFSYNDIDYTIISVFESNVLLNNRAGVKTFIGRYTKYHTFKKLDDRTILRDIEVYDIDGKLYTHRFLTKHFPVHISINTKEYYILTSKTKRQYLIPQGFEVIHLLKFINTTKVYNEGHEIMSKLTECKEAINRMPTTSNITECYNYIQSLYSEQSLIDMFNLNIRYISKTITLQGIVDKLLIKYNKHTKNMKCLNPSEHFKMFNKN
jgi:hypothetical protein